MEQRGPASDITSSGQGREWLFDLLDDLKHGGLELGPDDYARIDRVLIWLAGRGIRPEDEGAQAWLAPVVCASATEQARFYQLFDEHRPKRQESTSREHHQETMAPALSRAERVAEKRPARELWLRRFFGLGIFVLISVIAYLVAIFLNRHGWLAASSPPAPSPSAIPGPTGPITTGRWFEWTETVRKLLHEIVTRPLALLPIVGAVVFVQWRRSRRLWLMRELAPRPERAEKVVFASSIPRFYGDPGLRRQLGALRRHRPGPGGRLNVRRSVRSTIQAGGRPELRFGTRPRTPEYVLLVDRESPRDHLSIAADLMMGLFTEEHIITARYDYFGDPRRVVRPGDNGEQVEHLRLIDLAARHPNNSILLLSEPRSFFDQFGRPRPWLNDLREWGPAVVLTPSRPEDWNWPERELEREGLAVLPATAEGLAGYAERIKLGFESPLIQWPRVQEGRVDLNQRLLAQREKLLDDESPSKPVVDELLLELEGWLGVDTFEVFKAIAVFPRIEPALTLYLGDKLLNKKGKPLLDDAHFLLLARLPWLRTGRMPDWLRKALVIQLNSERLKEIITLLQAFLQPIEDSRTGAVTLEIGRRSGGFRDILLEWISRHPTEDLNDQILVDALTGRRPVELGTPVPTSLAQRLRGLVTANDSQAIALGVLAAAFVGIFHSQIVSALWLGWAGLVRVWPLVVAAVAGTLTTAAIVNRRFRAALQRWSLTLFSIIVALLGIVLLWTVGLRIELPHVPGYAVRYLEPSLLLLLIGAWLGHSYPRVAFPVLSILSVPFLVYIPLVIFIHGQPIGTSGNIGVLIAAFLVSRLASDRELVEQCFAANSISLRQTAFMLVGLSTVVYINERWFVLNWNPIYLLHVLMFAVGLSSIPLVALMIQIVLLGVALNPFLMPPLRLDFGILNIGSLLSWPGCCVNLLIILAFASDMRRSAGGKLNSLEPWGVFRIQAGDTSMTIGVPRAVIVWSLLTSAIIFSRAFTLTRHESPSFYYSWYSLLSDDVVAFLLVWAGVRFGRALPIAIVIGVAAVMGITALAGGFSVSANLKNVEVGFFSSSLLQKWPDIIWLTPYAIFGCKLHELLFPDLAAQKLAGSKAKSGSIKAAA